MVFLFSFLCSKKMNPNVPRYYLFFKRFHESNNEDLGTKSTSYVIRDFSKSVKMQSPG